MSQKFSLVLDWDIGQMMILGQMIYLGKIKIIYNGRDI